MYVAEQEFVFLMDKFRKLKSIDKMIDSEVTFAEMVILDQIIQCETDVTVSNLSEILNTTKANISKLVTSIEQKGYIERKDDIKDKRITHILITPKGKEVVLKTYEHFEELSKCIAKKMGEEDLKNLIELMKKLYIILEEEKKERGKTND